MKKLVSLVLIISILASSCLALGSIDADSNVELVNEIGLTELETESITSLIYAASVIADDLGLENRNFSEFEIGEEILVYEYTKTGLRQLEFSYHPILEGDELVLLIAMMRDGSANASLTSTLRNMIRENWTPGREISLVHDASGCHIFDGNNLTLINPRNTSTRCSLETASMSVLDTMMLSSINSRTIAVTFNHIPSSTTVNSTQSTVPIHTTTLLNVPFYSQAVRDENGKICVNLCWAAAIKMITQYTFGYSDTVQAIAKAQHGETQYDVGLSIQLALALLYTEYGIPYLAKTNKEDITFKLIYDSIHNTFEKENVIINSVNFPVPLYGDFIVEITDEDDNVIKTIQHAVVIRGTEKPTSYREYVYIVDPTDGYVISTFHSSDDDLFYLTDNGYTATASAVAYYDPDAEW